MLYANIRRIKARRALEQIGAISLALAGEPKHIGDLRIAAGEDTRTVGKWVQEAIIERRSNEIESRSGHA